MSEVGRYRKVYPRIWRHPGFQKLTKSAQQLALYALCGPQANRIGLFYFSPTVAAEDLNVAVETLRKGLVDVCETFGWTFDAAARVLFIPSWWRWNQPENANVLAGNLKDLNEVPPCALVDAFARNLQTLPGTFHQTFVECCRIRIPERSPIQEQEQGSGSGKHRAGARAARAKAADSNVGDPRRILQMDHERRIGAAIDADMLGGNGASRIVGFRRWNGVTVTELGAGNGATPTLGDVVDAIYRLAADNAKASAIFMHPRVWNTLRKLQDAQQRYQLQPDPTESARQSLFGVPVFISSQIAINETVGSSSDCSYIVVADMSRVVVVRRTQLVVLYDPYTSSATDQAAILTTSRWGFGVLDEEAVEVITGVR